MLKLEATRQSILTELKIVDEVLLGRAGIVAQGPGRVTLTEERAQLGGLQLDLDQPEIARRVDPARDVGMPFALWAMH